MFLMSSGCMMSELQRPAAPSQPNTHALLWLWGSEQTVAACFSVKWIYIPEEVHFRMQTQHPGCLGTVQRMIKPHWRANIMQATQCRYLFMGQINHKDAELFERLEKEPSVTAFILYEIPSMTHPTP